MEAQQMAGLDAVVLAAGAGSRFGGGKLVSPWRGGVLLDGVLSAAFAAPVRSVSVTWGADDQVPAAAERFAKHIGQSGRLHLVHVARHADGMAESLKAAISSVDLDSDGAFVFLGDMPRVALSMTSGLADALTDGFLAAAPSYDGRRGHPVLFAAALYPRLLALSGDTGATSVLAEIGGALVLVPSPDDGVLFDVDHPGDLGRAS
jgi:molybdenum cofactor cytidylyltransferase